MFTFSGKQQRLRVCHIIQNWIHDTGLGVELVDDQGLTSSRRANTHFRISDGQAALCDLLEDCWNETGHVKVTDLLYKIDDDLRAKVGELLYAMFRGDAAVEAWLRKVTPVAR